VAEVVAKRAGEVIAAGEPDLRAEAVRAMQQV